MEELVLVRERERERERESERERIGKKLECTRVFFWGHNDFWCCIVYAQGKKIERDAVGGGERERARERERIISLMSILTWQNLIALKINFKFKKLCLKK